MYLFRRVLLLWLILFVCICLALLVGRTTPDPLSAFGLEICDDYPCFAGITPGITTWDEAQSHLASYNVWRDTENELGLMFNDTIGADLSSYDETSVSLINVFDYTLIEFTPTVFPTVGSFILKYGEPCWVFLQTHTQGEQRLHVSTLAYPTMLIHFGTPQRFTPSTRTDLVQILDPTDDATDLCGNEQNAYAGLSWDGFASKQHYVDALLEKQQSR